MQEPKTIQHGKTEESCHCRECNFNNFGKSGCLAKAKYHNAKTRHTVDIYYETWREITNRWRKKVF